MTQVDLPDTDFWEDEGTTAEGHTRLRATVGGMHCSLCPGIIERTLGEHPGVYKVAVSLPQEQALIEYDSERVSPEQLHERLRAQGFTTADPRQAQDSEGPSELVSEGRRLLGGIVLSAVTVPLMFLDLAGRIGSWVAWPLGVLAVATVFVLAPHLVVMAVQSRRRGLLNQPVVLQSSAIAGLLGGAIGLVFRPAHYPTGGFFAVTVLVITYHTFARWFALLVRTRSSQSVRKLMDLQPDSVRLVRDGQERMVPLSAVTVGDRIRVRPGERVPVDGRVVSGRSAVDESLVTGESMPVEKHERSEVIGGSLNGSGTLLVEVSHVGEDTFLQQVIRNIEDARALKPGVLDLVDRVLKIYMPSVVAFAVLAAVFWTAVPAIQGDGADLNRALFATLSVLIMAYPCAVGMAAPLALVRGAGDAARQGIVMRTGEAFQTFHEVNQIVLDKTGTLTEGAFTVREVEATGDNEQLLALAAAAEASSEHPVGAAIVAAAKERGLDIPTVHDFEAISGHGVSATIDATVVLVGRPSFVAQQVGGLAEFDQRVTKLEDAGRTVVAVSRDGEPHGLIALGDQIRPEAHAVVAEIKREGITPVLVTGDNHSVAQRVARELGIDDVRAAVLPDGKAEIVRELQHHGRVAMVGDGINDAPALMQADVGLAMGAGTDVAIESSDIVIAGNRLDAVLAAREIGWRSYRRTQQNVVLAFLFNSIGVPLAATGLIYPVWAMAAMVISVTAVLTNSLRTKWSLMYSTIRSLDRRPDDEPTPADAYAR